MNQLVEHTPNPPAAVEATQPCVLAARRLMALRAGQGMPPTPPPADRKPWRVA
jgi:hypothetical protein